MFSPIVQIVDTPVENFTILMEISLGLFIALNSAHLLYIWAKIYVFDIPKFGWRWRWDVPKSSYSKYQETLLARFYNASGCSSLIFAAPLINFLWFPTTILLGSYALARVSRAVVRLRKALDEHVKDKGAHSGS